MQRPPARPRSFKGQIQSRSTALPQEPGRRQRLEIVQPLARLLRQGSRPRLRPAPQLQQQQQQQPGDGRQLLQQQQRRRVVARQEKVDAGTGQSPAGPSLGRMQVDPAAALTAQIPGLFHPLLVVVDLLVGPVVVVQVLGHQHSVARHLRLPVVQQPAPMAVGCGRLVRPLPGGGERRTGRRP